MEIKETDFQKDIQQIEQIPIIPTLLDVICQTTGMGFAAIARVTTDRWITCQVRDDIAFGLQPGDELDIKTTLCDEVRLHNGTIVIDCVDTDPNFCDHHTPRMYGFQSYISVPINRKDGSFFGTLCAIDPRPNNLSTPAITGMFKLFADLISFHLQATEQLEVSETRRLEEQAAFIKSAEIQKTFTEQLEKEVQERTRELEEKNTALKKMNAELESFAFISSHDLQEPLRKIQTFVTRINAKETENLSPAAKDWFSRIEDSAKRMQSLIEDLLAYSQTNPADYKFEITSINKIATAVKQDLAEEIYKKNAILEIEPMCEVSIIPFQFHQVFYNLISNALKFSNSHRQPVIKINGKIAQGKDLDHPQLATNVLYCHISVADNGIGFDQQYHEKIFELLQRLHGKNEYPGTGLGLAIVKKIIDNHHGFITATSQPNEGATFDIYIPITQHPV